MEGLEVVSRPPHGTSQGTMLFVHGAWHGAWCWADGMLDLAADAGFDAHALSLRHHGSSPSPGSLRWTGHDRFVEDVVEVAGRFDDVVLVGHSMGGYLVQKALEVMRPRAAVLLATVPISGTLRATLRFARRHPMQYLKVLGGLHLWPVVSTPALAGDMLLSDASHPRAAWLHQHLQDESFRTYLDMMFFALPKPARVDDPPPVLVVAASDDRLFSVAEQERTARAWSGDLVVVDGAPHDVMFGDDRRLMGEIVTWLGGVE